MSTAAEFLSHFDEQGRYKNNDGDVGVTFLTQSGSQYPGTLRFKNGLLVNAEMVGASPWGRVDESPLGGLKPLLYFPGERPLAVFIEQGRLVHHFEVQDQVSKEEFLTNFRMARNFFVHPRPRVEADSPTIDTAPISEALTRAALWLTPRSVDGFNAADFPELTADRQAELQRAVQAFKTVARQVPADKPPTSEQYREAETAFVDILKILSPYLPTAGESKKVENALRSVRFPRWVVNWDYELGTSEDGDAAVWVTVFTDGNVTRSDYGRFRSEIIPMIRQTLEAEGVDRWPYLKVRTSTEYKTA